MILNGSKTRRQPSDLECRSERISATKEGGAATAERIKKIAEEDELEDWLSVVNI